MTIREMIKNLQGEVRDTDLTPDRASEILSTLSALLGNVNDEIKRSQIIYNRKLLEILDSEEKANKARIKAETTPEYEEYLEAKNTKELVIEMIRGLKYFVKSKMEEYREGRY